MTGASGAAQGGVKWVLRLEGLAVLLLATLLYSQLQQGWGHFALWFLVPDLALLAYLISPQIGAVAYNSTHSYLGALGLSLFGHCFALPWALGLGLIWCAHLGFDRALGYGLKYAAGFQWTHLGQIGRQIKADL